MVLARLAGSPAPRLNRRAFVATAVSALAAPMILRASRASAANVVNVMAYDGFIPPAFRQHFEGETGIEVRLRAAASQAPELNLLIAESPHPQSDIATVAGHRLHQFVDADLLAPLETERLKSWDSLNPLYTTSDWITVNGGIMGVPLVIGAEMLMANAEKAGVPDSWGGMFDPRFKGRTTYSIEDFLQCVMAYQGADGTFMSYLDKPAAAAAAVDTARDLLIKTKGQVVKYYETGAELQQLLLGEEVVLAQGYAGTLAKLILDGRPIKLVVPKEGSFAFSYTLGVLKNAANPDNAYRFLDALLAYPGAAAAITRSSGYATTFVDADAGLTDAERTAYGIPADARPAALLPLRGAEAQLVAHRRRRRRGQGGLTVARRRARRNRLRSMLLFGGPVLWIGFAHVAPLLTMARISLLRTYPAATGGASGITWVNYAAFFVSPIYLTAFLRSVALAAITTALSLAMTYPLAHRIAFHVPPAKRFRQLTLLIAPFWASEIVRTYGIVLLLARRGAVNLVLQWACVTADPVPLLYGPFSLGFGMVYAVLATMLLPLYAALDRIPPELLDAAEGLGAGPWDRLINVIVPLAGRGIGAGCALVFLLSLDAFAVPMLLGGAETTLLPMTIGDLFASGIGRWPMGAAFGLILLLVGLMSAGAMLMLGRRRIVEAV